MAFGCLWHPLGQAGGPGLWPVPFIPSGWKCAHCMADFGGDEGSLHPGKAGRGVEGLPSWMWVPTFPKSHQLPLLLLTAFSTSLTKGACDPCPQDMPATGSPGCKFILEQSKMNQSSWVWHGEADWVPLESGTTSPMAKHPRTLLRWDSSSPCHRRDGGTSSGHKDTDSQSARNRAGAEFCNAIFLVTALFVWQPRFYRNDLGGCELHSSVLSRKSQGIPCWGDLLHQQIIL